MDTKDMELLLNKTAWGKLKTACGEKIHQKMIAL